MWFILALLSATTAATRRLYDKKLLHRVGHFTSGWLVQAVSLPTILLAVLVSGQWLHPLHLSTRFWVPVLLASVVYYPVYIYLYTHAIKSSELSSVLPIQSLSPLVAMLLSWATIGEHPTLASTIGIVIIVLGVYVLQLKGRQLHNPLRAFVADRASLYMFLCVCAVAVLSIGDKIAIGASNPLFYSLMSTVGGTAALYTIAHITKEPRLELSRLKHLSLGRIGVLQGVTASTYLMALATGPIAYVSAVRSTNILMGSILGIAFLEEALTKQKQAAFLFIWLGTILLAISP